MEMLFFQQGLGNGPGVKGEIDRAKYEVILEENLSQTASDFRQEWKFTF